MAVIGGQKLARRLAEITVKARGKAIVNVGFLAGSTYPDGTSVPMVAAVQEFGSPAQGIPPRPFFRNMIAAKQSGWPDGIGAALRATGMDPVKALGRVGEGISGQLRTSIKETNTPPLTPATIAAKGFAKPLVDTGHMLASVAYEVKAG